MLMALLTWHARRFVMAMSALTLVLLLWPIGQGEDAQDQQMSRHEEYNPNGMYFTDAD